MLRQTLEELVLGANNQKLPFLIIGGNAVILLGVPRFTRDIDFLITDTYREQWQTFLEEHGYQLFHRVNAFDQFECASGEQPGIDLMLVDQTVWDKLSEASRSVSITPALQVHVPDPMHLISMKLQAANTPTRRSGAQDFADVIALVKQFEIDLDDPVTKGIIIKYGGVSSLHKLNESL